MKVEIWSDVMCPYCYMGKRKFETALSQFNEAADVEIVWKSFQLSPDMITAPDKSIHQLLADLMEISIEEAKEYNDRVTNSAKQYGLVYNFDTAIPANSFNAHRFSHLAKQHGLQDEAEERLFKAYFSDGKNVDDIPTLIQLGVEIGLDADELKTALESDMYADDVRKDLYEARQIGVRGVPFFLFDNKLSVSGAQDSKVFLETLEKAYAQYSGKKLHQPWKLLKN
ncbi:MAG: DsbA family oxidoreductase [Paludibacter sp.]|nr:DsbA family oxidoreductase [Paludibacter sp.]